MRRFVVALVATLTVVACGGAPPLSAPPHATPTSAPETTVAPAPSSSAPTTTAPPTTAPIEEQLLEIQQAIENAQQDWGPCGEWHDLAISVGWPEAEWPKLSRVLFRESRCRPEAFNATDPNGGSRGILQVNQFWCRPSRYSEHGWLQDQGVLSDCLELHDGETALRAGLAIWYYSLNRNGNGWAPWAL